MSIFKKIGKIILGETEKPNNVTESATTSQAETHSTQEKKSIPDAIDTRLKIKKSTLALLDSLYLSNTEGCKSKRLIVWFDTDNTTFNAYSRFEQDLMDYWSIERGYVFDKVELKQGKPKNDGRKVDIGTDALIIYLQEQTNIIKESVVKKARITISGNRGSLLQEYYELSSEVLEKEHRKYYYIGLGEFPKMDSGYRQNHIAIDDVNNLETNKFVSRAHARIGFSENIGFYLQVEFGGSRVAGKRTRIFRNEEKIEVENIEAKEPLHDGDLIELGKAVLLKFEEIK